MDGRSDRRSKGAQMRRGVEFRLKSTTETETCIELIKRGNQVPDRKPAKKKKIYQRK